MATHSSILAWRITGMGEPGGLPSVGSYTVGHNWSDLAAAASALTFSSVPVFPVNRQLDPDLYCSFSAPSLELAISSRKASFFHHKWYAKTIIWIMRAETYQSFHQTVPGMKKLLRQHVLNAYVFRSRRVLILHHHHLSSIYLSIYLSPFPGYSVVKDLPACAEDVGLIPGLGRPSREGHPTHSSILAWELLWTEESGGLQSMGSKKNQT